MTAQEEIPTRPRVGCEGRLVLEFALELNLQWGALCEHGARDLIGDVRLQVFLLLEARIEKSPRSVRVWRLRLEQMHHQARACLRDRHEQRAGGDVLDLALPAAGEARAHAPLEGGARKLRVLGTEGFDAHALAARAYRLEADAMQRKACADFLRPRARHHVTAERGLHHQRGRHAIAKRYVPDLRSPRIVDGYRLP